MKDNIITYREMCDNENVQTLQRGMNYRLNQILIIYRLIITTVKQYDFT